MIRLEVVALPAPQGSKKGFVVGKRAVIVDDNKPTLRSWRAAVVETAEAFFADHPDEETIVDPVAIRVEFRFPKPVTDRHRHLHKGKPDLDKLLRSTLDALTNAAVIRDDSLVCSVSAVKRYAQHGETVGASIELEALGQVEQIAREASKLEAAAARKAAKAVAS